LIRTVIHVERGHLISDLAKFSPASPSAWGTLLSYRLSRPWFARHSGCRFFGWESKKTTTMPGMMSASTLPE
jgi:hypothetical protein